MNQTEKLKLNKPEDSDYFNIEDFNENADIIEKEILNNRNPTFTSAQKRENLKSNESLSVLFGKIMKFFTDLKSIAFTGSYNDLLDTPGIFMKSGSGAKAGLVPAPPTTAGTGKYLREDRTWTAPPDANQNISDAWSASITYGVNAYVIYNNAMWKCKVQNSGQTPAEGAYWTKTNVAKECSLLNSNLGTKPSGFSTLWDTLAGISHGSCIDANAIAYNLAIINGWDSSRKNCPSDFGNAFAIVVTVWVFTATTGDLSESRVQTLVSAGGGIWTRSYDGSSGVWSSWTSNRN